MSDGIILVDKPAGMTSFGVVARIRRVLTQRLRQEHDERGYCAPSAAAGGQSDSDRRCKCRVKVGHTGTLDPFATGLMIIVTGNECKNAQRYSKLDKVYTATIRLGEVSTTGDPEGEITMLSSRRPNRQEIMQVLDRFTGEISQRPPAFSAIKIDGQRAYKLARAGQNVEMPTRTVMVHSLELIAYDYPELTLRAHVDSGTYIRSLAADIGEVLETGAYCSRLRRITVGSRDVAEAWSLQDFGIDNETAP